MTDKPQRTLTLRVSPELHDWIMDQAHANLRSIGHQGAWFLQSLMDADGPARNGTVIDFVPASRIVPVRDDFGLLRSHPLTDDVA